MSASLVGSEMCIRDSQWSASLIPGRETFRGCRCVRVQLGRLHSVQYNRACAERSTRVQSPAVPAMAVAAVIVDGVHGCRRGSGAVRAQRAVGVRVGPS
eukprot:651642-Alexandrium_andersonii.AAC.2